MDQSSKVINCHFFIQRQMMSITFSLWTSPLKKNKTPQYIYGPLTYLFQTDQTHLLYGSSHGGHSSSLGPRATHTSQILGNWNGHLGAPLLYKVEWSKETQETAEGSWAQRIWISFSFLLTGETYLWEKMHCVVQDDQFGTRLHTINRTVQEGSSTFGLHLPSHMVHLLTNLGIKTYL